VLLLCIYLKIDLPPKLPYGIKVPANDRDASFDRKWPEVTLFLPDHGRVEIPIRININKSSFWNQQCRELISEAIGMWLIRSGVAPWQKGYPPKLEVVSAGERQFRIIKAISHQP
jgi:hypothetical protein